MRRIVLALLCSVAMSMCATPGVAGARVPRRRSQPDQSALVVPALEPLIGWQQTRSATEAARTSADAFRGREASQTAYEHLNAEQSKRLAASTFPTLISEPSGGLPPLPAGERVKTFESDYAAQVERPHHGRGVIESLDPIALESAPGHHRAIDLRPTDVGDAFEPAHPLVPVRIPRRLRGGVRFARTGLSLSPVSRDGSPLEGEGEVDGTAVVYPNSLVDTDTIAKPTTYGFSLETLLRSAGSPRVFSFRVGLPSGGSLRKSDDGSGAIDVIDNGATIARIPAPGARDAEGTSVPVSVDVSATVITVHLPETLDAYRLPIAVDPTVEDTIWQNEYYYSTYYRTAWYFAHNGPNFTAPEHPEKGSWTENIAGNHTESEWGGLFYTTRGASQIILSSMEGTWSDTNAHIQNYMVLYVPKEPYTEDYDTLPVATEPYGFGGYACAPARGCPETTAGPAPPENGNTAAYEQESTGPGTGYKATNTVTKARVELSQTQGPEISFNATSPTIYNSRTGEYITNVLYGAGSWLGPHAGAFEVRAKDPGLGLKYFRVGTFGWGDYKEYFANGECIGVQCPEYNYQGYTYASGMFDGEPNFEALAEDPVGLYADIYPQKIKVDGTPPHAIKVTGLQNGSYLPLGESNLKIQATDGSGSTKSSGVKSIAVKVDGSEVSAPSAACSPGPCTAATEIMLTARNYQPGQHSLIVTATDNANNMVQEEFVFKVHGANPVSVGPGSLDPSTGQLTLHSTDVSPSGGIGVSRTYQSRELTAGVEGPLGPQWTMDLGGDEKLTTNLNGNAVLSASGGADTTFVRKSTGEFESPPGDGNLKLEAKEREAGKGIAEYVLTNEKAGTRTRFEQPAGSEGAPPTPANQFGSESGQLNGPVSPTIDPSGNVWTTNYKSNLIEKYSATGALLGTYGSYGSAGGQFIAPWGIAADPRNGNVYVTDQGNNRIEELSSSGVFIKTFGWGVKDGHPEYEVCTSECKAGLGGVGIGQFNGLAGLDVDSAGNLWVADYGNNRIQEFNEKSEYVRAFGSAGKGNEQFEGPLNIALSSGNLYITDYRNNRVQKFSTTGTSLGHFGVGGSGAGQFSSPYGIASDPRTGNLYVADFGNARMQEFTPAGALITKFGSSGSGFGQFTSPTGVAVSSAGSVYVLDYNTNRGEEWTRPTWIPSEAGGPLSASTTTFSYSAVESEGQTTIEPTEALAPVPSGVSCGTKIEELKRGCRALSFNYAGATTATGENESEWGDYKGRLTRVYYHAWDPNKSVMAEPVVAQYAYDNKGRLRAEWDPRLAKPLKTIYGYDVEGHVTAITPPGQASWGLVYGSIAGSPSSGRLLKMTRPATLWNGSPVQNTERPSLSGAPDAGVTMGVSSGKWSNSPIAYSYQWEDCNAGETECTAIPGATNPTYKVAVSDAGHLLNSVVTATNGAGSVSVKSYSKEIQAFAFTKYELPTESYPGGITAGSDGNMWFTTYKSKIGKVTPSGAITEYSLPSGKGGQISGGPDGNIWFTEWEGNAIGRITTSGSVTLYPLPASSGATGITSGPDGNVWFTETSTNKIGKITTSGSITEYQLPSSSYPYFITAGPDGNLWFTESLGNKVGKITPAGSITEYALPTGSKPYGIAAGPDGNLWVAENGTDKIAKVTTSGAISEYALHVYHAPYGISAGPEGALWFSAEDTRESYREGYVGRIATAGAITETVVPGAQIAKLAKGPDGNVWVADAWWVGKLNSTGSGLEQGKGAALEPATTVEYGVPVAGASAPYQLGSKEAEAWGQKDDPVEGVAVFPQDEPQTWPASSYKRATIHYWDSQGRLVNTAAPTGAIATSEYNSTNDVVRTLTPDNRSAALSETGKTAEASRLLDTQSIYSAGGTELLETRGPQHRVKLASGPEVLAREHSKYSYDEGAPSEFAGDGLVTKTTAGAEYEGKEADVRSTLTSYSGQGNLGWRLRKPTSTTTDPSGLDLVHKTVYDPNTGNVVESSTPAANSETVYPFSYSLAFGAEGSGNGQFKHPGASATDASGNVWVVDELNNRVEKFTSSETFVAAYGSKGSGNLQFLNPWGIAINQSTGNVYVADKGNNRVEELSAAGAFVATFGSSGSGALKEPTGAATDSAGNLWVSDWGHNRVVEFGPEGAFVREAGSSGSGSGQINGPGGLAIAEGSVFVADYYNSRIDQFSTSGGSLGQFGSKGSGAGQLKEPYAVAANPSTGALYVSDTGNNRIEEFTPAGRYLTAWQTWGPAHQLSNPTGLTVAASGRLYVSDSFGNKVSVWTPPEAGAAKLTYGAQFGSAGSGNGQLATPIDAAIDGEGNIWVTDFGNNRIEEFSAEGTFVAAYGEAGSGNGQFNGPGGIDVNQSTGKIYVADTNNGRIEEFAKTGKFVKAFGTSGTGALTRPGSLKLDSAGNVWVPDISADRIVEFNSNGKFIAAFGSEGSGEGQFKQPTGLAFSGENIYVADTANHRIEELSSSGAFIRQFGKEGEGGGELYVPEGIAADGAGNLYVTDNAAGHVEEFTPGGGYLATFATKGSGEGQLNAPIGDAVDAAGDLYVVDTGDNRIEKWSNGEAVHATATVYYSVGANSEYPTCGSHPEWANMACETFPVAQPNTPGIPNLPTTTATYTMWGVPETVTERFGSTTRTKKQTYDAAGRALTSEVSSSADSALPKVKNEYNDKTGALEKQSASSEGKTRSSTSVENSLGQLEKYTDADGVTSTYAYDVDERVQEVNYGTVDGETASQIYTYDPTSGALTSLYDTAAGTFTAKYDVELKMTSETYPNGMTATFTRNQVGQGVGIEYVKTTHCSEKCTWFSDTVTPGIYSETLKQVSTLSEEPSYTYNSVGSLTNVQEAPAGKGCTTREYAYDEEGDRTSLTTREPGTKGECTSGGGHIEAHSYDAAGRLNDAGVSYDAFGNITALPSGDAGGHELKTSYYVDNQVAAQEQEQEGKATTVGFHYDPAGRVRETIGSGGKATVSHYAGTGEALTWTTEGSAIWTRNIPGIDATLCATQTSGQAPVLQLHDLQGNTVATAALSENETKLLSTYNSTEFGVPRSGTTVPRYAWLGATGLSTELPTSGVVTTGESSYVPEIGRALQGEAVASPGSFPNGSGAVGIVQATYLEAASQQFKAIAVEHEAALEAAARREAEENAPFCVKYPHGEINGEFCSPPEEEEGGINGPEEDPTGILWWKAADERAHMFRNWAHEVADAAEKFHWDIGSGIPALLYDKGEAEEEAANMLEACARKVKGYSPDGVCWLSYTHHQVDWPFVGVFDILDTFSVEECTWKSGHTAKHEWFNCPGHGSYAG